MGPLNLAGEHSRSTYLNSGTVPTWIASEIHNRLGDDEFDKILDADTDQQAIESARHRRNLGGVGKPHPQILLGVGHRTPLKES
jgi:hypothetical protein